MQRFESALRRNDPSAVIFFAPRGTRAGGFWLPELVREITEAATFVLLIGEHGLGSWQTFEYYEALDRHVKQQDFRMQVVLLDGQPAPGLPFLRQLNWIVAADPASERVVAQLVEGAAVGGAPLGELWRHTAPYRGLGAMTESDADFFFGRERETVEVIAALAAASNRLPILVGGSGVGKSSLAKAGVLAALMRQDWPETGVNAGPWPDALVESRRWCFLKLRPGTEPLRALVEPFLSIWQFDLIDPRRVARLNEWTENLVTGRITLCDLLDATEIRLEEQGQNRPPAFLIYIDQGEELYVRADERQRGRFSEVLAGSLGDPRLRVMMSMRADFFGELQRDEPLYAIHQLINVPPPARK